MRSAMMIKGQTTCGGASFRRSKENRDFKQQGMLEY